MAKHKQYLRDLNNRLRGTTVLYHLNVSRVCITCSVISLKKKELQMRVDSFCQMSPSQKELKPEQLIYLYILLEVLKTNLFETPNFTIYLSLDLKTLWLKSKILKFDSCTKICTIHGRGVSNERICNKV